MHLLSSGDERPLFAALIHKKVSRSDSGIDILSNQPLVKNWQGVRREQKTHSKLNCSLGCHFDHGGKVAFE